jgi:hypothetical protein
MSKDIVQAFAADNFTVIKEHTLENGNKGYCAEHRTAKNLVNDQKKRAYYVEGSSYDMGYLMGYLAMDDVERMSTVFIQNIIFEFFKENPNEFFLIQWIKSVFKKYIQKQLSNWIYSIADDVFKDIPFEYIHEIHGLADGYCDACKGSGRVPKISFKDLWVLNVGIDCLLAFVYAPDAFLEKLPKFTPKPKPDLFKVPVFCNGFSVFGNAVSDMISGKKAHYFGRDFMFPTADVFQDTACHIIYNPDAKDGRLPLVSLSAPGFAGSMTAMNTAGVAMGVDMCPSGNCDHHRAGLNSLLLVRDTIHRGAGAEQALDNVIKAQRGVSWNYIISDGAHGQAVAVETGASTGTLDFVSFPDGDLQQLGLLPGRQFLDENETQTHRNGLMVRWHDYQYPEIFLKFNEALFKAYEKKYDPVHFGEQGYISERKNGTIENNCPYSFYFAPQRENKDDVLIMTNHYIVPSMRLCSMNQWAVKVSEGQLDDIQWRYDRLNDLILSHYGSIDWKEAWNLINFLGPNGCYETDYYDHNRDYPYIDEHGRKRLTKQVLGSVSLCNLTTKVIESLYGYYVDAPVKTTLMNYVD